jgi:molybdate transport system permease protein
MPLAIYLGFELDLRVSLTLSLILLFTSAAVLLVVKGVLGRRGSVVSDSFMM